MIPSELPKITQGLNGNNLTPKSLLLSLKFNVLMLLKKIKKKEEDVKFKGTERLKELFRKKKSVFLIISILQR